MPKQKKALSPNEQSEQSERFRAEVGRLIEAGELSPTDADRFLDSLVKSAKTTSSPGQGGEE